MTFPHRWKRSIKIKQYLIPDMPLSVVRDHVVSVLKKDQAYGADDEFTEVVDEMEDTDTAEWFDQTLDALYDWADAERVWIGP